jgi:hypothetical protein
VRVREASSVLDPSLVESLMARLSDEDRDAAVRGLELLAVAAQAQMGERSTVAREAEATGAEGGR